ncbi:alpha/beta-hydrolase [Clavulina sp. PMI_390]|nr:alpha/beta-hydrolase [Clavulina sp. PMI_390]
MSIFSTPGWKTGKFNNEIYHYLSVKPTLQDKKTFVFLHGVPTGALSLRKILPYMLAEGHGIILPELLGFGRSSRPKETERYSRIGMADAVAEILAAEGVEKAIILGHGWGAWIATRFALKYPQYAEGLIQIGIPFIPLEAKPFDPHKINTACKPSLGYAPLGYLIFMASDAALELLMGHTEAFLRLMYDDRPNFASAYTFYDTGALEASLRADLKPPIPSWITEQEMQEVLDFVQKQDMNAMLNYFRFGMFHFGEEDGDLPMRLSTPYLYIECKTGPMVPSPVVQAQLAHCDHITIKTLNGGYWIMEQEPNNVFAGIRQWLETTFA